MRHARAMGAICASLLALGAAWVCTQSQAAAPSCELLGVGPEWVTLEVTSASETNLAVEVSEDLVHWRDLLNVDTRLDTVLVSDRIMAQSREGGRFYRLREPGLSLDQARASWQSQGLASYTYHYRRRCFCIPWTPKEADVTVSGGQVIRVTNVVYIPSPDPSEEPPAQPDLSEFKTIDELFVLIEEAKQTADTVIVSYDPTWGFPSRIAIDQVWEFVDDEDAYWVEVLIPEKPETP